MISQDGPAPSLICPGLQSTNRPLPLWPILWGSCFCPLHFHLSVGKILGHGPLCCGPGPQLRSEGTEGSPKGGKKMPTPQGVSPRPGRTSRLILSSAEDTDLPPSLRVSGGAPLLALGPAARGHTAVSRRPSHPAAPAVLASPGLFPCFGPWSPQWEASQEHKGAELQVGTEPTANPPSGWL